MRFFCITVFLCVGVSAQQANIPDDAVVATVGDKKYTAGEMRAITDKLPSQARQFMLVNPAGAIEQYLIVQHLASDAEKQGIDKQPPYKTDLEWQRMMSLATADMTVYRAKISIPGEDQRKYYQEHATDFQQAKVRVIYVAFSSGQVKSDRKVLTEPEAKTKIQDLRQKLLGGADFATLAKENSDDKESAAKGGEFGIVKHNSSQPADVKNAIFSLKSGGISEPVKQPNGYYIFKVDEFTTQPYDEVSSQINEKMRQDKYDEWFKGIQNRYKVKVENPDFFPRQPTPPGSR